MGVEILCFDLDGTIVDSHTRPELLRQVCLDVAASLRLDGETLADAHAATWDAYWVDIQDDWWAGRISNADMTRETWRRTLASLGTEASDEELDRLVSLDHAAARRSHHRFPDVLAALQSVRDAGFRIGVVTNGGGDLQREKLRDTGLEDAFEVVVVSGELGIAKPDPRIFERALAEFGVTADRAAHVGDTLSSDIEGAVAAGVLPVWLNRSGESSDYRGLEIRSLGELTSILGQ